MNVLRRFPVSLAQLEIDFYWFSNDILYLFGQTSDMSELNDVSSKKKSIEELVAEHKRKTHLSICPDPDVAKDQTRWFLDHASPTEGLLTASGGWK